METYGLTWVGKADAVRESREPARGMLVADASRSIGADGHVFVEGDNLEALRLLRPSYAGVVKLIYIDPPYNTGNHFAYQDRFGNRREQHSEWLSMMYPRLALARELLRDDGVIAVSIDDNEVATLRLLLDEIFGSEQFVATVCVRSRRSVSNDMVMSPAHNYLLLYCRDWATLHATRAEFGLEPNLDGFDLEDDRGRYKLVPVDGPGGARKGNPHYEFMGVAGHWRYSRETMRAKYDEGLIVVRKGSLQQKYYLDAAAAKRRTDTTWWDEGMETATATRKLKELMGEAVFDSPKPVALVRRLLALAARADGDVVLDFFAGSGTTAHAVLEQNADDGARRRFVCVTLPEPTNPLSTAHAAGYEKVSDVTYARIRRVLDDLPGPGLQTLRVVSEPAREEGEHEEVQPCMPTSVTT